jgi:hypothetical protein
MHAWFDLYSQKQTQLVTPSIQIQLQSTTKQKCPFHYMVHRRFMQMKQVLYFFDSIRKEK